MSGYKKLTPAVKRRWVAALRRKTKNVYKQGHGQLVNDWDEFCCLGVLCDLMVGVEDGWEWEKGGPGHWVFKSGPVSRSSVDVPGQVREFVNLDPDAESFLIVLNDDEEASFPTIASWIDKNL